jgi:hypothetical protein
VCCGRSSTTSAQLLSRQCLMTTVRRRPRSISNPSTPPPLLLALPPLPSLLHPIFTSYPCPPPLYFDRRMHSTAAPPLQQTVAGVAATGPGAGAGLGTGPVPGDADESRYYRNVTEAATSRGLAEDRPQPRRRSPSHGREPRLGLNGSWPVDLRHRRL